MNERPSNEQELITRLQALLGAYQGEMGDDIAGEKSLMLAEGVKILSSIDPGAPDAVGKMALLEAAIRKEDK